MMRTACKVMAILVLLTTVSVSGYAENPDVQIVTLENVGMSMSLGSAAAGNANDIKYLGYITVKTEKGEKMKIDWPEKSFFEMTGGKVTGGMKLQIKKSKNTNKWEVIKIVGKSNNK